MQVSSQRAPARRWAQILYLVLASLVLLGIFLQGFLIGAYLFGGAVWGRDAHSLLGLVLLVLSLLVALTGLLAQVSGWMKIWGFLLFVLVLLQIVVGSLGESAPLLGALHPANPMLVFGRSLYLICRIRQVMGAGQGLGSG